MDERTRVTEELLNRGVSKLLAHAAVRHAPDSFREFPVHRYPVSDLVELNTTAVPLVSLLKHGYLGFATTHCGDVFVLDEKDVGPNGEPAVYLFSHEKSWDKQTRDEVRAFGRRVANSADHLIRVADANLLDSTPRFDPFELDQPQPWVGVAEEVIADLVYQSTMPGTQGAPMSPITETGAAKIRYAAFCTAGPLMALGGIPAWLNGPTWLHLSMLCAGVGLGTLWLLIYFATVHVDKHLRWIVPSATGLLVALALSCLAAGLIPPQEILINSIAGLLVLYIALQIHTFGSTRWRVDRSNHSFFIASNRVSSSCLTTSRF